MGSRFFQTWPVILTAAAAAAALAGWLVWPPAPDLPLRQPSERERPSPVVASPADRGRLFPGSGKPSSLTQMWPGFRGLGRDGVYRSEAAVSEQDRSTAGPGVGRSRWRLTLGEGYAGAAIRHGCAYVLDYDRDSGSDVLRCLSLDDGQEVWRYGYPVKIKRNHGMSRTVPCASDDYVVTLGPKCHVLCLDAKTGEFCWMIDLVAEYGTKVPPWYAGQCPLIDGDRAIIAPGGSSLMIAVDCATGEVLWRTPNPHGWTMSHSSVVAMDLGERRTYVYAAGGGVVGIDAADGSILWSTDAWRIDIATVPTPVVVDKRRVFLSGGYDSGCMMLAIDQDEGRICTAQPQWRLEADVFGATQQTPVLMGGYIYGVRPDGQMACLSLEGKVQWTSGAAARFGLGPFIAVGNRLLVLADDGMLTIAARSPQSWQPLAQTRILTGHEVWGPLAFAGGLLIARDLTEMVCVELTVP
jgi:outer membrane protein assembly factor BamB